MSRGSDNGSSPKNRKYAWGETDTTDTADTTDEKEVELDDVYETEILESSPVKEIKPGETGMEQKASKTNFATHFDPKIGNLDDLEGLESLSPIEDNKDAIGVPSEVAPEDSEIYVPPAPARSMINNKNQEPNSQTAKAQSSILSSLRGGNDKKGR